MTNCFDRVDKERTVLIARDRFMYCAPSRPSFKLRCATPIWAESDSVNVVKELSHGSNLVFLGLFISGFEAVAIDRTCLVGNGL